VSGHNYNVLEGVGYDAARRRVKRERELLGRNSFHQFRSGLVALDRLDVLAAFYLSYLAKVYADVGHRDEAWRCVADAKTSIDTTKEALFEAEVSRVAGEIALQSPNPEMTKAEAYFERALAVARQQQAKSFELRAAISLARLWRSQGKVRQARELLAPVYGWFTEGFDTRDLKEAKALLEELAA
jgi:predicted ATPase